MTETRRWLEANGTSLTWRMLGAALVGTLGLALVALGLGVLLGRLGTYRLLPPTVVLGWVGLVSVIVMGVVWARRRLREMRPRVLARQVEVESGLRHGSIGGVVESTPNSGSPALMSLADNRAVTWLGEHGVTALSRERARTNRALRNGTATLLAGAVLFFMAGPTNGASSQFWHPVATLAGPLSPVVLTVDRNEVRRGDTVTVSLLAQGRRRATLWVREPGEPWHASEVRLDSSGAAQFLIGPLDSDRFMTASSGRRSSDTLHVRVLFPAFFTDLQLLARFPSYIDRPDEPLAPGTDPVPLPVGTRIFTSGRITLAISSAEWRSGDEAIPLGFDGESFSGTLRVSRSARWQLHVTVQDGVPLDDDLPELNLMAVPDSAPVVAVPIPGADTAAPFSLRQPLVIDTRDDYGLTLVELVSWRADRLGGTDEPVADTIPLPGSMPDRAVLQWVLDLNERGFLPGDTAHFKVRATDNAPRTHVTESREYVLWLPSMSELRDEMRDRSRAAQQGVDSLSQVQEELARSLEELAAARDRGVELQPDAEGATEELPFNSAERARALSEQQQEAIERAARLQEELRELADAAWSAGITDPEFHKQLQDIEELLEQAITDELRERLEALRAALEELDPERVREALQQLAESADRLREQLERGQELFERAAIEGEMTTLAADADELTQRQEQWNRSLESEAADSALAGREEELAASTDSLAAQLEQLAEALERAESQGEQTQQSAQSAARASGQMQQAASQAQQGQRGEARQSGEAAEQSLQPLAEQLRQQRDELRESWRQEVIAAMDRALVETARLAEQQQEVMQRVNRGESGPDVRGAQAAARAGVDRILEQLQGAAGKNALVSPQLGTALGFSKLRMAEALDQLQRANPNTRQAGELAGEALDGLNAVAYSLLRSRAEVAGAQSGSGLSEAMERLAELAEQQGQLNSETSGMLPLMPNPDQQLLQALQALAQQQQSLADQMDRLQAEEDVSGIDELAEEARELAQELEAARLDRETVERQEQLFRRLLDAGRTLRSDEEEDERKQRVSETADPRNVQLPASLDQLPTATPRFPYPTWEQLRSLTPDERRLILDYFRRLNRGRP